jgi:hypothetical protein
LRHVGEELTGPWVLGRPEELRGVRFLDDLALVHHHDLIGDSSRESSSCVTMTMVIKL